MWLDQIFLNQSHLCLLLHVRHLQFSPFLMAHEIMLPQPPWHHHPSHPYSSSPNQSLFSPRRPSPRMSLQSPFLLHLFPFPCLSPMVPPPPLFFFPTPPPNPSPSSSFPLRHLRYWMRPLRCLSSLPMRQCIMDTPSLSPHHLSFPSPYSGSTLTFSRSSRWTANIPHRQKRHGEIRHLDNNPSRQISHDFPSQKVRHRRRPR